MIDKTVLNNLMELGRIDGQSPVYKFLEMLLTLQEFGLEEQEVALEILDKLYVAYKTLGTYYVYETDLVGVDKLMQIADKKVALFVTDNSKLDVLNKLLGLGWVNKNPNNSELYYITEQAFPIVSSYYLRDTLFVVSEYLVGAFKEIALYLRAIPVIIDEALLDSLNEPVPDSDLLGGGITVGDVRQIMNSSRYFQDKNATVATKEIKKSR